MERREFFAAAVCLASPAAFAVGGEDDVAIRKVVQRYVDAREARDASDIEPLLTPDADQLVSDGTWRKGRDELVKGMLESSKKNPAQRTITIESVRLLTPDIAMADGRYVQKVRNGGDDREMWTSITLKKVDAGWRIAAIRNMLPAEQPKPTPADADPQAVLNEAVNLARSGKFEEALQKHIWFHDNALRISPAMSGVRHSFALSYWVDLGEKYPKARAALVAIRDKDVELMKTQAASSRVFSDVKSINAYLNESPKTIELFKLVDVGKASLAERCYIFAEDVLAEAGEYALCSKYIPNPELKLQRSKTLYMLILDREKAMPEGSTIPKSSGPMFVKSSCRLIEILVGAGRRPEAEKIRKEAIEVYDDRNIREAIEDAEKKIKGRGK